jgi:hypothetical protein
MRCLTIVFALLLPAGPGACGPLRAQESPYDGVPFREIRVGLEGEAYQLEYRHYPEPHAVDLSAPGGGTGTAFGTARAFWWALVTGPDYDAVAVHTRTAAGQPAPRPADESGHMEVARDILSGGVQLYGEIAYGEYRIFVYRYPKSIPRNLGLPVRRFGERYFVVTDLVEADPLANRMSAFRWDIDRLAAEHPAR